jgi:hypothetical protein
MGRDESLEEIVSRRNKQLLSFFTMHGYNVRIVGDDHKPSVILDETVLLSCYVKNFDLCFTKEPLGDEIVKCFKLKTEPDVSKLELQEAIEQCTHRPVYKVKLANTDDMFLVGYNYIDGKEPAEKYPVFAKHKPKVFFDMEYTVRLVESLGKDNYSLVIV